MGFPVIHEYHHDLRKMVQQISQICLSEEFLALTEELEGLYARTEADRASIIAFQDALYALIAQEEIELRNSGA